MSKKDIAITSLYFIVLAVLIGTLWICSENGHLDSYECCECPSYVTDLQGVNATDWGYGE